MAHELSDQDIERWLAQLDDGAAQEVFASLNQTTVERPVDSRVLHRIERAALTQVMTSSERGTSAWPVRISANRKTWKSVAMATAGVLMVGFAMANARSVQAAWRALLVWVPGIGVAQSANGATVAVLSTPTTGLWHHHAVTVEGLVITPREIRAQVEGTGSMPETMVFQTARGTAVRLALDWGGSAGSQWSGFYTAHGAFASAIYAGASTLVVGTAPSARIGVHLHTATTVSNLAQLGPTVSHHGIRVTAIATRYGHSAVLSLVPQTRAAHSIDSVGTPSVTSLTAGVSSPRRLTRVQTMGNADEYQFRAPARASRYHVVVGSVEVGYAATASLTLPVPRTGSQVVNGRSTLAGFPVRITHVQRVTNDHRAYLRLYFGFGASPPDTVHPISVSVTAAALSGGFTAIERVNPRTGALIWSDVPIRPHQRTVTVNLSGPAVSVPGPWTFNVGLPPAH